MPELATNLSPAPPALCQNLGNSGKNAYLNDTAFYCLNQPEYPPKIIIQSLAGSFIDFKLKLPAGVNRRDITQN